MIEEKTPAAASTERVLRMLSKLYNHTAQMLYAFSHSLLLNPKQKSISKNWSVR